MKKIHKKVNIIPVIGKADSCTMKEVNMFKTKVNIPPLFFIFYKVAVVLLPLTVIQVGLMQGMDD